MRQVVGQDIELLSHANLYYPALVTCPVGCTCSYHTLVRLPNLVKPDHKIFVQLHIACLLSWSDSLICTNMHIKNYRTNNVVSEYTNMHHNPHNHQQCSFSHIIGPINPHKSSQNGKLQCNLSLK
jgi:hypothetical protein